MRTRVTAPVRTIALLPLGATATAPHILLLLLLHIYNSSRRHYPWFVKWHWIKGKHQQLFSFMGLELFKRPLNMNLLRRDRHCWLCCCYSWCFKSTFWRSLNACHASLSSVLLAPEYSFISPFLCWFDWNIQGIFVGPLSVRPWRGFLNFYVYNLRKPYV